MKDKIRILVADDSPTAMSVIKSQLETFGYEVISAVDGEEAINKLCDDSPDLLILDIMMPKLDGHAVIDRLNKDETIAPIPVIMLTSKHDAETIKKSFHAGIIDYISKPYQAAVLAKKIRKALNKKKEC